VKRKNFVLFVLASFFIALCWVVSCSAKATAQSAETLSAKGDEYLESGKFDNAINSYTQAIRQDPDYLPAYVNRGHSYFLMGDHDNATADYTKAIQLYPNDIMLFYYLRTSYMEKGDYDKALWLPLQ